MFRCSDGERENRRVTGDREHGPLFGRENRALVRTGPRGRVTVRPSARRAPGRVPVKMTTGPAQERARVLSGAQMRCPQQQEGSGVGTGTKGFHRCLRFLGKVGSELMLRGRGGGARGVRRQGVSLPPESGGRTHREIARDRQAARRAAWRP